MIKFRLPQHPETDTWLHSTVTQGFRKIVAGEQRRALRDLIGKCKVSSDPEVQNSVRAYLVVGDLHRTLGGDVDDGEPDGGDQELERPDGG